jgi:hypothetical protein
MRGDVGVGQTEETSVWSWGWFSLLTLSAVLTIGIVTVAVVRGEALE